MTDFTLRPWREADAASIARYADNEKIAANLRDVFPWPYRRQDAAAFVADCVRTRAGANWPGPSRRTASRRQHHPDPGERRVPPERGAGLLAGGALLGPGHHDPGRPGDVRPSFGTWDIVRIHAEPYARNAASRRVLEKAGFTLEGTLRRSVCKTREMLDSCIYALLKEELP